MTINLKAKVVTQHLEDLAGTRIQREMRFLFHDGDKISITSSRYTLTFGQKRSINADVRITLHQQGNFLISSSLPAHQNKCQKTGGHFKTVYPEKKINQNIFQCRKRRPHLTATTFLNFLVMVYQCAALFLSRIQPRAEPNATTASLPGISNSYRSISTTPWMACSPRG